MWPPRWIRRKSVIPLVLVGGAALLGGLGWLLGPVWALTGALLGPVAALGALLYAFVRSRPDPDVLLSAGRAQEAWRQLQYEIAFIRAQLGRRPVFREILADRLVTMAQVLRALDNDPRALETVTEAVAIYRDLSDRQDRIAGPLARARVQQADLLAQLGRHGEALAAIEPAVATFRRLAVDDRSAYLPSLAAALTRQGDELGHLDRIAEARAAGAEAEMIRTDMLPSAHQRDSVR